MAPVILKGETLGQKHQYYNNLLKEIISKDALPEDIPKISYDEPDIDNLLKIDTASNRRNVKYIVEVLKCEDMLYISRALKQSVWLITDKEYAHIVNPRFVQSELLPHMMSKAGNKLLLSIRLNLKDETRVEEFYNYYKEINQLQTAFKWLPNCSLSFIEMAVKKHSKVIPRNLLIRLCEKSFTVLEIFTQTNSDDSYGIRNLISKSEFLLNNYAEKFIDIVNAQDPYSIPIFCRKSTRLIMKTRPDVILNNFEKYATKIHVPTFTKFLKREDVKDFVTKHAANKHLKSWFTFETMKYFISRMPVQGRFDFIKQTCIEKKRGGFHEGLLEDWIRDDSVLMSCASGRPQTSNDSIYRWYIFAPFDTAFRDLKKIIQSESNPKERGAMFAVLMKCASRNVQNIQTLLKYYLDKHINEPFKFKRHFVNIVLSHSKSHKFDEQTWRILDYIFSSMEVYSESEHNVQLHLKHIILYKVVHNATVPEIIEKKFEFDTLKTFQSKLNEVEKEKIFNYLYQFIVTVIKSFVVNSESDFKQVRKHIINVLNLLIDWNKDILDYGEVLEKIRELIKIKSEKYDTEDLSEIYNIKKSWRKYMFKESLSLNPTSETLVNALKHGPQILTVVTENVTIHDSISSPQYLKKIRIYWPQSLAKNAEDFFLSQCNNKTKIKNSIRGLCTLLPQKQLAHLISKHKPDVYKINWRETNEITHGIQKHFASYMYLARPQPQVDLILLYAKGDYLQYALPSLHSILFNVSINRSLEHIPTILKSPVSLQKHGLNIAFTKVKPDELLKILKNTWETTKNYSLRATVFKLVFELLCKEQNETFIIEMWQVFSKFIDGITSDENKNMYLILGQVSKVPLLVRHEYCIKSYKCLKSLLPKTNCDYIIKSVIFSTIDIMGSLDEDFVAEIIFDSFDKVITQEFNQRSQVISASLLSTKSEAVQTYRYERIFVPFFTKCLSHFNQTGTVGNFVKYNFSNVLKELLNGIPYRVLVLCAADVITPTKLLNDIHKDLEQNMSVQDNYVLILTWKLAAEYMKAIDEHRCQINPEEQECAKNKFDESKLNIIHLAASPVFGKIVLEELREQVKKFFPSIYHLFAKALDEIFKHFAFSYEIILAILEVIVENADLIEAHLLVLELMPMYFSEDKPKEQKYKILKTLASHPSAEVRIHSRHKLHIEEI